MSQQPAPYEGKLCRHVNQIAHVTQGEFNKGVIFTCISLFENQVKNCMLHVLYVNTASEFNQESDRPLQNHCLFMNLHVHKAQKIRS